MSARQVEKDDDDPDPNSLDDVDVVAEVDNDVLRSGMQAVVEQSQSLEARASAKKHPLGHPVDGGCARSP
jgi:hypothetical protein